MQDENLFMYSDEIDTGIRAKRNDYLLAVTKNAICWHQHINANNSDSRSPLSGFLMGRNEIYLAKKHFGIIVIFLTIVTRFKTAIRLIIAATIKQRSENVKLFNRYYLKGAFAGSFGINKLPKNI